MKHTSKKPIEIHIEGDGLTKQCIRAIELLYLNRPKLFTIVFNRQCSFMAKARIYHTRYRDKWTKSRMEYYRRVVNLMDYYCREYNRLKQTKTPYRLIPKYAKNS